MASGDTLVTLQAAAFVAAVSNGALPAIVNNQVVAAFDPTTQQTAVASFELPKNYGGGGLTIRIAWAAATATTNAVVWSAAIERQAAGGTAFSTDSFATAVQATAATTAGSTGVETYTTIALTSGAQMDGLLAEEHGRIAIARVAADANDTMAGNAYLISVLIKET